VYAAGPAPSPVVWVGLAEITEPTLVPATIARAAGLAPSSDVDRQLAEALADRPILLVLDNVEHLPTVPALVSALLGAGTGLRVLATSRAPLRCAGEHEFPVRPLGLPEPGQPPERIGATPAVQLFVARAKAARPEYEPSDADLELLTEVCRRLDGLPLAIELAARRMSVFTVAELSAALDEGGISLLATGYRDAPAQQRTLAATLDWSEHLLPAPSRELLHRLTVFAGGARLNDVSPVCGESLAETVEALGDLVDHSLVRCDPDPDGATRVRLLEVVRSHASGHLPAAERNRLLERHATHYRDFAQRAGEGLAGADQPAWLSAVDADLGNLRLAAGTEAGIAGRLWWFWWASGHWVTGRTLLGRLTKRLIDLDEPLARAVWFAAGHLAFLTGDPAAPEFLAPLAAQPSNVDGAYAALMLGALTGADDASMAGPLGVLHAGAEVDADGGLRLGTALLGYALLGLGRGDLALAEGFAAEALAVFDRIGQPYGRAASAARLGDIARVGGDPVTAGRHYARALPLMHASGVRPDLPAVLQNQARIQHDLGDLDASDAAFREALALQRALGSRRGQAECLNGLAENRLARGEVETAAAFGGAASALYDRYHPFVQAPSAPTGPERDWRRGYSDPETQIREVLEVDARGE